MNTFVDPIYLQFLYSYVVLLSLAGVMIGELL